MCDGFLASFATGGRFGRDEGFFEISARCQPRHGTLPAQEPPKNSDMFCRSSQSNFKADCRSLKAPTATLSRHLQAENRQRNSSIDVQNLRRLKPQFATFAALGTQASWTWEEKEAMHPSPVWSEHWVVFEKSEPNCSEMSQLTPEALASLASLEPYIHPSKSGSQKSGSLVVLADVSWSMGMVGDQVCMYGRSLRTRAL